MDKIVSTLGNDTFENPKFKEQYIQLCRNLDMREKEEEKAASEDAGNVSKLKKNGKQKTKILNFFYFPLFQSRLLLTTGPRSPCPATRS